MSESKLVDGKTGELVGGAYNYSTTGGNYVTTTTSGYVPATTTYAYGNGSGVAANQQTVTYTTNTGNAQNIYGGYYAGGPTTTTYTTGNYAVGGAVAPAGQVNVSGQVVGTTVNTGKEVIKGESRIEYVPFEKKVIEYKDQAKVERVPKKVKKIEYKEERKIESIPKEVTVTDYYAVEYLRQYIPQYVPEKRIEYVQVPKKQIRYEYIPVERQIVHYPEQPLEVERTAASAAVAAQGATTTYTTHGGNYATSQAPVSYATQGATTTTYTTTQVPATYVTQGATYTTGGQGVTYTNGGATYTTGGQGATYTTGGQGVTYITGGQGATYSQGGLAYTSTPATQPVEKTVLYSTNTAVSGGNVYATGPQYTTYEEQKVSGGQWSEGYPYAPQGNYEYTYSNGEYSGAQK